MNVERMKLMVTMLREVSVGTWTSSVAPTLNPVNSGHDSVRFDIRTWVRGSVKDGCGFAACAVGHACLDQRFIDQGLFERGGIPRFKPPVQETEYLFQTNDWLAVKEFFGIDTTTVEYLFSGDSYTDDDDIPLDVTPDMVADRIDKEIAVYLSAKQVEDDQLLEDLSRE